MKPGTTAAVLALLFVLLTVFSTVADAKETPATRLYLVSVGNGDPDNITLRALNVIRRSAVIFCSDDIREKFADLLHEKEIHKTGLRVHRTYMRKAGDRQSAIKEVGRIDGIIRTAVREGKTVSVLDSGDPTIYRPNMWFMEVFEDLQPEIVPGVSSFNAANAALRKGVTSGEITRSVVLTNGAEIDKLASARTTMVFFTMHLSIGEIVKKLKPYYPPETPVAVVLQAGYGKRKASSGERWIPFSTR
jgi:precorrin-4 methylase